MQRAMQRTLEGRRLDDTEGIAGCGVQGRVAEHGKASGDIGGCTHVQETPSIGTYLRHSPITQDRSTC